MKKLSLFTCLALTLVIPVTATAKEKTPKQVLKDMTSSSELVVMAYKSGGMSALTTLSQDCFNQISQADEFTCIYIDLGARHIDQPMAKENNWPENEYFADEQFLPRVAPLFHKRNISMVDANKMLSETSIYISRMVDSEINSSGKELSSKKTKAKKMLGGVIDDNPNAKPLGAADAKRKKQKNRWQDENGFMHYPDGSASSSPVD